MSDLANRAITQAISQIGFTEHPVGSNWGHPVQDYLAVVGINFPASWCMGFVCWCFKKAAEDLNQPPLGYRSGGVLDMWSHYVKNQVTIPQIGDIFIMDFGQGHGHTGIVERTDDTYIYTIEGNTNDTGSREGYEVCRRRRLKTSIKGYLRY